MFRQLYTIFGLIGIVGITACTRDIHHNSTTLAPVPAATPAPSTTNNAQEGASSGGGGYVTTNSKKLLTLVITDLQKEIRQASPFLFRDLPQGWSQLKLADVIQNIRSNSTKDVQRDNSDLLFNYGSDEKGAYIEALRPYFMVYGQIPMSYTSPETSAYLKSIILDLRLKILHEVAHLIGKNEIDAEQFGFDLLKKLERDFYVCMIPLKEVATTPNVLWVSPNGLNWVKQVGGGSMHCEGPEPGCEARYEFNWIHPNNWIFHQAKNQTVASAHLITYFSHLDPQPYANLKSKWDKEDNPPGIQWDKDFGGPQSTMVMDSMKEGSAELSTRYKERYGSNGKPRQSDIDIILNFELSPSGIKQLKSGHASVPLMKIVLQPPTNLVTMDNNPLAPLGEYINDKRDFELKCEYFGEANK